MAATAPARPQEPLAAGVVPLAQPQAAEAPSPVAAPGIKVFATDDEASKDSPSLRAQSQGPSSDTSEKDTDEKDSDSGDEDDATTVNQQTQKHYAGSSSDTKDSKADTTQGNSDSQGSSDTQGTSVHTSAHSEGSHSVLNSGNDSAGPVLTELSGADSVWEKSEKEGEEPEREGRVLLIKNINHKTTVPEFCQLLEAESFELSSAKVTLVHIPCSRKRRNARGFAVVHCATAEVAQELRAHFHGRKFGRHRMFNVEHAERVQNTAVAAHGGLQSLPPDYAPALINPEDLAMLGIDSEAGMPDPEWEAFQ